MNSIDPNTTGKLYFHLPPLLDSPSNPCLAENKLQNCKSWDLYCKGFSKSDIEEGTFVKQNLSIYIPRWFPYRRK